MKWLSSLITWAWPYLCLLSPENEGRHGCLASQDFIFIFSITLKMPNYCRSLGASLNSVYSASASLALPQLLSKVWMIQHINCIQWVVIASHQLQHIFMVRKCVRTYYWPSQGSKAITLLTAEQRLVFTYCLVSDPPDT